MALDSQLLTINQFVNAEGFFWEDTYSHYRVGMQALLKDDHFSAAIWGAVFTEALLKDILTEFDVSYDKNELNQLVNKVKSHIKKTEMSPKEKNRYREIADRCEDIRNKRNLIVHDSGTDRASIASDAGEIYRYLKLIILKYIDTGVARAIRERKEKKHSEEKADKPAPDFPVFISMNTPHTFEQEFFIESFCKRLEEIGVEPKRVVTNVYDQKDPMGVVRDVIAQCNAVIVLGLERTHSYHFEDKAGSPSCKEGTHRKYASSWLQLESGMAIGLRKDIFILHQKGIHEDGIFDHGWNSYIPVSMDTPLDAYCGQVDQLLDQLKKFMKDYQKK